MSTTTIAPAGSRTRRINAACGFAAWSAGILFVLPIAWMVLTSFHRESDAATNPPSLTAELTLDGYRAFFGW